MIVAHVSGIPVEESLLQLAPAAAAMAAAPAGVERGAAALA